MKSVLILSIGLLLTLSGCAHHSSPAPNDAVVHGNVGVTMASKDLSRATGHHAPN
jgi:hypothetical protein